MCTVATCAWPFFKQAAIMNMMYPLFILVACKSDPLKAYKEGIICSLFITLTSALGLQDRHVTPCLMPVKLPASNSNSAHTIALSHLQCQRSRRLSSMGLYR